MNAASLRRVLRVVYTGRPGQSLGLRVGHGAVAGIVTLAALGAVLPEPEKSVDRVDASDARPFAALPAPTTEAPATPAETVAPSATSVRTTPASPRPVTTTAKPVVAAPRPVVRATTRPPAPKPSPKPSPKPAASTCGAAPNPWGFNHCGRGSLISSPPAAFCDYFDCIASFWESTNGHVMRCDDGMYSHSGGRQGSCSHHGGNDVPLYG